MGLKRNKVLPIQLLVVLVLLTSIVGCGSTRNPRSPYIPPPADLNRRDWEQAIVQLREDPEGLIPPQTYSLGPGDVLAISIIGRPDLLGIDEEGIDNRARFTVTESPFIILPYLGSIRVHGKTQEQLQEDLTVAYSRLVKDPVVFVTVEKFHWNQISVLGSVRSPGRFPLEPGDTLLEVIFRAGGLTFGGRTGDLPPKRILKIYRQMDPTRRYSDMSLEELLTMIRETGTLTPRREIILPLDSFILGGDLSFNITMQPGDIVYIPPAGTVTVHGAVMAPRVVFLGPGLRSFAQIMTEVGGLKWRATTNVEIVRQRPDGATESIFVDARAIMKREEPDVLIEDNDQIFVYVHPIRNVFAGIGSFFRATIATGVNATYSPV